MTRLRRRMTNPGWNAVVVTSTALVFGAVGCGSGASNDGASAAAESDLSGTIRIDGSRAVAPLTEAVAGEFQDANPGVTVSAGTSGTGAGFEALCARRIDVGNAAWVIDPKARGLCREAGVVYAEVPIAFQALAVLVNADNPIDCVTIEQLEAIWDSKSTISSWNEIPDSEEEFDEMLTLYAPSADSSAFEYFTEATDGVVGGSRTDYNDIGEDDSAMVAAVAGAPGGMGYLNLFSLSGNEDAVKALEVDNGEGCVASSVGTAQDASYAPLSRPVFLYLSDVALRKPAVRAFIDYYLENVTGVAESVGFAPLTEEQLEGSKALVRRAGTGRK